MESSKIPIQHMNWRPPSQSELTPMLFNTGLTHLGLEASNYSSVLLITFEIGFNFDLESFFTTFLETFQTKQQKQ